MTLRFDKLNGLLPAVIQDDKTSQVLMLGFMNEEAYQRTVKSRKVTFFSRSKNRIWMKGESSGNTMEVVSIHVDCDEDTILIRANPSGPVCHTGESTCFKDDTGTNLEFLSTLEQIIKQRADSTDSKSYTRQLLDRGINKVAQKVGEEAVELVIESKDDNKDLFLGEAADLTYHLLVLLRAKKIDLAEVISVLKERHKAT